MKKYVEDNPEVTVNDIVKDLAFENASEYIRLMKNSGEIQKDENDLLSLIVR